MALSKELKEALKGVKVGEGDSAVSVLKLVEEINDKAEAKDKVQKANEELTTQRKEWEKQEKEFKSKISSFEKALKEKDDKLTILEKEKLSPEERETLKKTEDIIAELNAVREQQKQHTEELKTEKELRIKAEKERFEASVESRKQSQKTALTNELNKYKITGDKNVQALYTLYGEGFAKMDIEENGNMSEKYYTKTSDGKLATSTLEETVKRFAETNLHLVSGSEHTGTGQNHQRTTDYETQYTYGNLRDQRNRAREMMSKR